MASKRPKCSTCSKPLSPWGKTSSGKKRYGCNFCGRTKIYKQSTPRVNFFELFRQYVLWGFTYKALSSLSNYSIRHLVQQFHIFLVQDPPAVPLVNQSIYKEAYLLIDGLWFGRWFVLMVYRQSKNLTILHISPMGKEVKTKITKDLRILKDGYRFTGVVSDGGTGIVGAVRAVFPHIPHQICLAHMHRQILACIGKRPKEYRVQELRILADHVWLIESKEALKWWKHQLDEWIKRNDIYLWEIKYDEYGKWWYVHKGVRKAVRILLAIQTTSFQFLDHPLMPKTTNELEAQFGHLGHRWLTHRGLKRERWEQFFKWFVYFYNQEKLTASKKKQV